MAGLGTFVGSAVEETLTRLRAVKRALEEDALIMIVRVLRIISRGADDLLLLTATKASRLHHHVAIAANA
jgi:hypothetical protein